MWTRVLPWGRKKSRSWQSDSFRQTSSSLTCTYSQFNCRINNELNIMDNGSAIHKYFTTDHTMCSCAATPNTKYLHKDNESWLKPHSFILCVKLDPDNSEVMWQQQATRVTDLTDCESFHEQLREWIHTEWHCFQKGADDVRLTRHLRSCHCGSTHACF